MIDKLTMYSSVRKNLLLYLKGDDFLTVDIAEWVWIDLAKDVPDFDATIPEQNRELFNECFAVLLKKIEDAIKE